MTILPDVLQPGLNIVFCGTAAGKKSAEAGAYYANPGNKFWRILYETGLTPRQLSPAEFRALPHYGLGLTDLAQHTFGSDTDLHPHDFNPDHFRDKMRLVAPRFIAFNSKRAALEFYGRKTVSYGLQPDTLGSSRIFVLPSTSGLACRAWNATYWHTLAALVRELN